MITAAAHHAWLLALRPAARAFQRALADPEATQRAVLRRLIAENHGSAFGKAHGFSRVRSVEDFRNAVPVRTYNELLPWIERAKRGEARVLTEAPVLMFECSSGSAGAAKFIPYTSSLFREFQRALGPWLCDVYDADPPLARGPAYWSVTPIGRARRQTEGGTRIGVDNDSEYLGPLSGWLATRLVAVPREVAACTDMDSALYLTLRFLLQHRSLTLLSVWNPSLLTVLCRVLETHGEQLAADLRSGGVARTDALPTSVRERLRRRARGDSHQADILLSMLRAGVMQPLDLWPHLRLISCWTSAEARGVLGDVQRLFPGVPIQGKGLLATEGVVTIPMRRFGGAVPALTSHFLEFVDAQSRCSLMAHELEAGREYVPLLTTGGGLWRYRIGDRVRVVTSDVLPVLEFVGRDDGVSDLRGEKLGPAFVGGVLEAMRSAGSLVDTFTMLAPSPARDGYTLFTDAVAADVDLLDRLLRTNPHYAYCRDLGQLRAPAVMRIEGDAHAQYLRHCERLQRRAGTAKLVPLDRNPGWETAFTVRDHACPG